MYIHINLSGVAIDATETEKYVGLNNGRKVITHDKEKAVGVVASDETISPLVKAELSPGWYTVSKLIPVAELPEDFAPNRYSYEDGKMIPYTGTAPEKNETLTEKSMTASVELAECRAAIEELYEAMEV